MPGEKSESPAEVLRFRYSILMAVTLILGLTSTVITVLVSESGVRNFQKQKIESLALILNTQRIKSLRGTPEDISDPVYQDLKARLMRVRQVNPEIRFLYLMQATGKGIIFLIDSEDPNSDDYSAPGDVYDEASEVFQSAFGSNITGFELDRDRWGFWLSSFAPVVDFPGGEIIAVLGADIDAYSEYFYPIIRAALLPVTAFAFLLMVLWINRKYMLYQTEALEEKSSILHIISHEVRTPLTEIRWACESAMAESDFGQNPVIKNALTQVFKSSVQMIQRINNLEKASTISESKNISKQAVNIEELIKKSADQFKKVANLGGVELILDLSGGQIPGEVQGDPEALGLAMQNVLLNLIYYADANTSVTVSGRIDQEKNVLEIDFSGQGKPISVEEINMVFAGYHRGSKFSDHTEGTGIGLFMAKKIVVMHKGDIKVSVDGNKTIFRIRLPFQDR